VHLTFLQAPTLIQKRIWLFSFIFWITLSSLFTVWRINDEIMEFNTDLSEKALSLHRLVSQRADQHDAHLTGLSALASTNQKPLFGMMTSLSSTIQKFYPRITSIDLVTRSPNNPLEIFSTRQSSLDNLTIQQINKAALAATGPLRIIPKDGYYLLVKRSPNTDAARYGLSLTIDANALLQNDLDFGANSAISLLTPKGASILRIGDASSDGFFPQELKFRQVLGSQSQPLVLEIRKIVTPAGLFPWASSLTFTLFLGFVLFAVNTYWKQLRHAKLAEKRALLRENEARIAQASRINSLGEMASGIAHELTQPLTAILSQSQAGERIAKLKPEETEKIVSVLNAISQQATRAGNILERLRKWSTKSTKGLEQVDLNKVAQDINDLMMADLKEKGIRLKLSLSSTAPIILADAVQIEQVVFNLARNGVEAMERIQNGCLEIDTRMNDGWTVITISDNGTGIPADIRPNLYDPFFTTKTNGMGLGLSLCEGIVERFGGILKVENGKDCGVVSKVSFKLDQSNG